MNDESKTKRPAFRRCDCENFSLTISKIAVKRFKSRYKDSFKNLIADALLGPKYCKPIFKWEADCSRCGKIYWVSDTKKSMNERLKETGFPADKSAMRRQSGPSLANRLRDRGFQPADEPKLSNALAGICGTVTLE